ncbi:hypothetical protein BLNAU_22696 [Blattamonas nauphoetae]|uniref:Uncharacterized protein n=1 Tax=Blattamonas nauphoetae TaxID=2049346 RepID=A0ABQ9WWH3_9EUKA|nr:hypothetical protein BLNAU_22696 [Blattamonas nauphoetae]
MLKEFLASAERNEAAHARLVDVNFDADMYTQQIMLSYRSISVINVHREDTEPLTQIDLDDLLQLVDGEHFRHSFVLFNPAHPFSFILDQVFQHNKIPEYKMYQMTKVMVHQANIRTDVCSVCVVGDQLRTQGRKLAEETRLDLTECIRRHNEDTIFQRIKHNADIADLLGNECVIVADFKENLNLPMGRTQVGESFSSRAPVQMLTFVLFRRVGAKIQQRVFTVLSRTQSILMDKSFSTVTTMKWWSDGAPHFHSREFVLFLLVDLRIHNR